MTLVQTCINRNSPNGAWQYPIHPDARNKRSIGNSFWEMPRGRRSTRYEKMIDEGKIDLELPLFSYIQGAEGLDAITSATERYFSSYTFRDGKRVNVTHLHITDIDTQCPLFNSSTIQ